MSTLKFLKPQIGPLENFCDRLGHQDDFDNKVFAMEPSILASASRARQKLGGKVGSKLKLIRTFTQKTNMLNPQKMEVWFR